MLSLPAFLQLLPSRLSRGPYLNAVFNHRQPLAPAHALWWPPRSPDAQPKTVVLFIPGNPGLLDFYTPFLTALQDKDIDQNLAILAHAHIDHTPGICQSSEPESRHSLTAQVQNAIEALDALCKTFKHSKVVVIGHSVGSWVSLQVLKARPTSVSGVFLLFPTICHIAGTPNGRNLSKIFKPVPRQIISHLSYVTRIIPQWVLQKLFLAWPTAQLGVLRDLLNSPASINAALSMANEEMQTICDLDVTLLQGHRHRIWLFFADQDQWVGKQKEHILSHFEPDAGALRVVHGNPDIPHAFCINHGEIVAEQCHQWLSDPFQ